MVYHWNRTGLLEILVSHTCTIFIQGMLAFIFFHNIHLAFLSKSTEPLFVKHENSKVMLAYEPASKAFPNSLFSSLLTISNGTMSLHHPKYVAALFSGQTGKMFLGMVVIHVNYLPLQLEQSGAEEVSVKRSHWKIQSM
mgnify:CR=1 FL=1